MVEVRPGRGETGGPPGEARKAGPGGAVRGAEGERQSGVVRSTVGCEVRCISKVGEDGGV
jgi:hypothetical protein